jgi:hypothetical protein
MDMFSNTQRDPWGRIVFIYLLGSDKSFIGSSEFDTVEVQEIH